MKTIVTNTSKEPVTRAGMSFGPGDNPVKGQLSAGKVAQIEKHPDLSISQVDDAPAKQKKENESK